MLDSFKSAGKALIKYTERPTDAVCVKPSWAASAKGQVSVGSVARLASSVAASAGEVPNYERRRSR